MTDFRIKTYMRTYVQIVNRWREIRMAHQRVNVDLPTWTPCMKLLGTRRLGQGAIRSTSGVIVWSRSDPFTLGNTKVLAMMRSS